MTLLTTMTSEPHVGESPSKPYTVSSFRHALAGLNLDQYRLKSVQDMSGLFMKTDTVDEFLETFLPYPSTAPKRRSRTKNPFESLVDADRELETDVVEEFVSLCLCFGGQHLLM